MKLRHLIISLFLLWIGVAAAADDFEIKGSVGSDSILFPMSENDKLEYYGDQGYRLDYQMKYKSKHLLGLVSLFGSGYVEDSSYNNLYIKQAFLSLRTGPFSLKGGYDVFDTSIMDVIQPLNLVNARNYANYHLFEETQYLGELFLGSQLEISIGKLGVIWFPTVSDHLLPASDSALFPYKQVPGMSLDEEYWMEYQGDRGDSLFLQGGVYGDFYLSGLELSLQYWGLSDKSAVLPGLNTSDSKLYRLNLFSHNLGVSSLWIWDQLTFRLEALYKTYSSIREDNLKDFNVFTNETLQGYTNPSDNLSVAGGVELSLDHYNGSQSNLAIEIQRIFIFEEDKPEIENIFSHDLAVIYSFFLNDIKNTNFSVRGVWDYQAMNEGVVSLKGERRLSDQVKVQMATSLPISTEDSEGGLAPFAGDYSMNLNLVHSF